MSDTLSLGERMQRLRGAARLAAIGEVVSQWRASGQSQTAFCREAGIATVTLGRWLRRLESAKAADSADPVLVEIGVRKGTGIHDGYQVVLPGGAHVRVPADFREQDLTRLLRALSSC